MKRVESTTCYKRQSLVVYNVLYVKGQSLQYDTRDSLLYS